MRVSELADRIRKRNKHFAHFDDTDLIQMASRKNPKLMEFLDKGDLENARRESRQKQISKQRQKEFKSLSGYSRSMSGVGEGMLDIFMGLKQMLGGNTDKFQEDKEAYMDASEGDVAAGAGEIIGSIAGTAFIPGATGAKIAGKVAAPLAKASIMAGTAVATGAGFGATEHVDEGETRLKNTIAGTLFGGAGYGVGKMVSKVGSKAINAIKGKYENASIQELMELSKKYDIPLPIEAVTGKGKSTGKMLEGIPLVGTGGYMRKGSEKAQQAIKKESDKIQPDWDDAIQESLGRKLKAGKEQATANYNMVEELSGGANINPEHSIKEIEGTLKTFGKSRTPKHNPAIKYLEDLKESMASKKMDFSELRATREALGKDASDFARNNPTASKMLLEIRKTIDKDIDSVIEDQIKSMTKRKGIAVAKKIESQTFSDVEGTKKILDVSDKLEIKSAMEKELSSQVQKGKELKSVYETAKTQYRENVVPYKKKEIINALKTDTPDEIFNKFIKKGGGDKAKNFYKLLDDDGKDALRDGFLDNAIKGSTKDGFTSPATLAGYIHRMSIPKESIFEGKRLDELNGFAKIMRHAERYGQLNESPSNGMQLIPYLKSGALIGAGAAAYRSPIATAAGVVATSGLTALTSFMRTHGKGLLLASSEYKPGSKAFERILTEIMSNLPKASAVTGKNLQE